MEENNYIFAQTIKEFNFILSKIDRKLDFTCVPLNYELMLFCEKNNLKFINPEKYIKNEYHKHTILKVLGVLDKLNLNLNFDHNVKIEILGFMRFRLNSFFFFEKMINSLNIKKSTKIYLSGWVDEHPKSLDSYYISDVAKLFKKKINVIFVSKLKIRTNNRVQFSLIDKDIINNEKKNILLSNLGYNFYRLILFSKRKYNFIVLNTRINLIKSLIFKFFNTKIYNFKVSNVNRKRTNIKFSLKSRDIKVKKFLTSEMRKFSIYFENLLDFQKTVKKFYKKYKPDLVITNIIRGKEGSFNCIAKKEKIATLCIPHGTLSPYYDKYDQLYKRYISEAVFYDKSDFYSVQSKICEKFLDQQGFNKDKFLYGNLILSEKKNYSEGDFFLYATTLKDCYNSVLHGCEYFFEFDKNLKNLNQIANLENIRIVVKLHPNQEHCQRYLVKKYKYLKFSKTKISKLLEKTIATISFSSTVIEDSLMSKVPVILLDLFKRYEHYKVDTNSKNSPLFYVTNLQKLKNIFKYLREKNDFKFDDLIYLNTFKYNINQNLERILGK